MNLMRSLFNAPVNLPGPFGNIANFFRQYRQFAQDPVGNILGMRNVNVPKDFNGTPKDLVNYLTSTGQMTQDQFQQFGQQANDIQNMLPRF